MTTATAERDTDRGSATVNPGFAGSLTYLLMNFPLGIAAFVGLITLTAVGIGTAVIWVGLPILALAVLICRGAGRLERARLYALLDVYIDMPYQPLPAGGQKVRWTARLRDAATRRDFAYLLLLFPIGVVQFVLLVGFWSTSLALAGLPIYFRFLPDGAFYFPTEQWRWVTVDSTVEALPWAVLGVLFGAVSVALTKAMARTHARFAMALLGPSQPPARATTQPSPLVLDETPPAQPVAGW